MVNEGKCSKHVNKERGKRDEGNGLHRYRWECCNISYHNLFTHNEKQMMREPSQRWGSFSVSHTSKQWCHGAGDLKTPNSDVRGNKINIKRTENFNPVKERRKIKSKDLKSLNAPTYSSHHREREREREGKAAVLTFSLRIITPIFLHWYCFYTLSNN